MEQRDVLIVGAGIAGLACAVALLPLGYRVTVVEASAILGGRAASCTDPFSGDVIDVGPHVVLAEYRNMFRLLDMLGTRESIVWHTGKLLTLLEAGTCTMMRVHKLPPPLHLLPSMLATRAVSRADKLSNLPAVRLALKATEAELMALDDTPAHELLQTLGVSKRFIDWFWRTAALTVMNVPLERCSATTLLRVYANILGHNDYRIGFPAIGLSNLFVPAACRQLAEAGGVLRESCGAARLLIENDRCIGVMTQDGQMLQARHTVVAVPPQAAAPLMPGRLAERWQIFEPSPYVSVYLWFDRKLTREKFWTRVWNPNDMNSDFYDLSNIRAGWSERPSVIASNIIYSHRVGDLDDSVIIERTLRELAEFAPEAAHAKILHAVVHRVPMAIPCPYPGTEHARPSTRTPLSGLLLAGDWIQTGFPASMESAVYSGFRAAEEIARAEGKELNLALAPRSPTGFSRLYRALA